MSWRSRAVEAAYSAHDTASRGLGLKANATLAAQFIATGDPHHPIIRAVAAATAVAAIVADRFIPVPDRDVRYATFDE